MILKYIIFLLCFPLLLLIGSPLEDPSVYFSQGPMPAWVKSCDFPLEPVPAKPSQVNWQNLLYNTQEHIEEQTYYLHQAIKVLTQRGVEDIG